MKKQTIPIFFASDNNYVPFLATAMKSLIVNASPKYNYEINVLQTGISEKNQQKMRNMAEDNFKIRFIDIEPLLTDIKERLKLRLRDYYSISIYYRLFIESLFKQYQKVLYLDADIVVEGDISELYNADIGDNLLGVVQDGVVQADERLIDSFTRSLGFDANDYFNSGVLVMNLKEFRKEMILDKFLYLLEHYNFDTIAPDQDYLNVLCHGKVKYLEKGWDVMPNADKEIDMNHLYIIHYNMFKKPWNYDCTPLVENFRKYAKMTPYARVIEDMRMDYTEDKKEAEDLAYAKMVMRNDDIANSTVNFGKVITQDFWNTDRVGEMMEKNKGRIKVIENIERAIKEGNYNKKVEEGDPVITQKLREKYIQNYDSTKKKIRHKVEFEIANAITNTITRQINKNTEIVGLENLEGIEGGAIVTSNHFNFVDTTIIKNMMNNIKKSRKYAIIVQETNFLMKGYLGWLIRNNKTIPLSLDHKYLSENFLPTLETLLNRGYYILIYPEQEMWYNYRKPRNPMPGAYHYATKFNVPIIPCFTEIQDMDKEDREGFKKSKYILHIMPPIYPDPNKSLKENKEEMRKKDFEYKVAAYEKAYNRKYDEDYDRTKDIAGW